MGDSSFIASRRSLLRAGFGAAVGASLASLVPHRVLLARTTTGREQWLSEARAIVARIRTPNFPLREKELQVGALSEAHQARDLIQRTIDEFARDGGGTIRVGAGEWSLQGPLRLKSNVRLHLEAGAHLLFADDPDLYLPAVLTRWEGTETFGYSPFIYSYQAHNVAITGKGTISVEASKSSQWRSNEAWHQRELRRSGRSGKPVYERVHDDDGALAPSLIQFFGCSAVLVEGITTLSTPFWGIHFVYSHDVTVRDVTIKTMRVNNDGIDIDSSDHVLVERCTFETGDDCIAIKSGRDLDGRSIANPSESIVIRKCAMKHGKSAAVALGSEMSGGIRGVYLYDCVIDRVDTVLDIKSNLDRGGVVERIRAWNLSVDMSDTFFEVTTTYHSYSGGTFAPTIRDVAIVDSSVAQSKVGIQIKGASESPVTDLFFENLSLQRCETPMYSVNAKNVHIHQCRANGRELKS